MNNAKIVLIGMPGSGKTTLGEQVASQMGFSFYDLDEVIIRQEGKSIADIFFEEGEGYFRQAETKALEHQLNLNESMILSTGGGAPCYNDNMERINKKAISVFLDVPLLQIIQRMTSSELSLRPLFNGLDAGGINAKLNSMYIDRVAYYDQAKIKLSGENISAELLVSELMSLFKN